MATCSVEGCENGAKARGWCEKHYQRWRKNGDPLVGESVQTCPNCGIAFKARANKQYCSMPCKYKVKRSIDVLQNRRSNSSNRHQNHTARNFVRFGTRKCLYCEEDYVPYSDSSKYCSRTCSFKGRPIFGTPQHVQICECCFKEFNSWKRTSRMCSTKCWNRANPYKRVANTAKKCVICQNDFETSHGMQVTCSKRCSEEHIKRRDVERHKKYISELADCHVAGTLSLPIEIARPLIPLKREQLRNLRESRHKKGETL